MCVTQAETPQNKVTVSLNFLYCFGANFSHIRGGCRASREHRRRGRRALFCRVGCRGSIASAWSAPGCCAVQKQPSNRPYRLELGRVGVIASGQQVFQHTPGRPKIRGNGLLRLDPHFWGRAASCSHKVSTTSRPFAVNRSR